MPVSPSFRQLEPHEKAESKKVSDQELKMQFKIQKVKKTTERLPEEVHIEVNGGNVRTADVS